jgi:MFS transporter, SP family, sugar:H+ symporter
MSHSVGRVFPLSAPPSGLSFHSTSSRKTIFCNTDRPVPFIMAPTNFDSLRANWKCALACILVSLSPFQYGIDFGLIGGIQAMIGFLEVFGYPAPETPLGWNLTPEVQQLMGSLMTLGAVIASALAGPLSRKLGRKSCLWIGCGLCCVSDAIMMGTTNLAGLYSGRLLIGISNGREISSTEQDAGTC